MTVLKHTVVLFSLLAFSTIVVAQKPKPVKAKETPVQKVVLPKLKIALGSRSDSVLTVSVDETIDLINKPLTVTDDKKAVYAIASYQCLYRRKAVTEDEESGKVSPVSSMVAQTFKTTPLSAIWIKTISEQLKAGEEIFFFDIVVKSADGRLMFAPHLKLVVR